MPSCCGCKFLFGNGEGYSDWTWLDTEVTCAKGANPQLPADDPYDWKNDKPDEDQWDPTKNGRCALYDPGPFITLSPDRSESPEKLGADEEMSALLRAGGFYCD